MIRSQIILLVEDNRDDVDLTIRAFSKSKTTSEIVVTRDGEEALEYLFATGRYANPEIAALPDVVLLDLNLPKMDGFHVLRQLRAHERTKRLPVVILTSSRDNQDLIRSYDCGANSFVCKPVDFQQFREVAIQISQYWLEVNQVPSMSHMEAP